MVCERCGMPITETHICVPAAAYLERRIQKLERRIEELEESVDQLLDRKRGQKPGHSSGRQ